MSDVRYYIDLLAVQTTNAKLSAEIVYKLRKDKKMSQKQLAEKIGSSEEEIMLLERGYGITNNLRMKLVIFFTKLYEVAV